MDVPLERDRLVGSYVVRDLLADSPSSTVWRVDHAQRGTRHVLKVLNRTDSRRHVRLQQEAVLGERLHHRNVVPCTDLVEVDGRPALVMDYVDGPSLDQWLRTDPTDDLLTRLRVFRGIVAGVSVAHQAGIVHRALKPSNVLIQAEVTPGGRTELVARICDFGLAKALAAEVGRFGGLTTVNTGLGTWGYAAPEQVRDASSVDHRADLYSLGCLLYELLCGMGPFGHLGQFDALQAQREGRYRRVADFVPGLPPTLSTLVDRLLAPDPAGRPASAQEVLDALDEVVTATEAGLHTPVAGSAAEGRGELAPLVALCAIPLSAIAVGATVVFLFG